MSPLWSTLVLGDSTASSKIASRQGHGSSLSFSACNTQFSMPCRTSIPINTTQSTANAAGGLMTSTSTQSFKNLLHNYLPTTKLLRRSRQYMYMLNGFEKKCLQGTPLDYSRPIRAGNVFHSGTHRHPYFNSIKISEICTGTRAIISTSHPPPQNVHFTIIAKS